MGKYLSILTVLVSTDYLKKKKLRNKQYIIVRANNLKFPAFITTSKKNKGTPVFFEHDLVPDGILETGFSIESEMKWLYAKRVVFTIAEASVTKSLQETNKETLLLVQKGPSTFPNIDVLSEFLQNELVKCEPILKIGSKIKLKYLTQNYIFTVMDIFPCFYEKFIHLLHEIGWRCFESTQVDIVNTVEKIKLKNELSFDNFGGYQSEINNLQENIQNYIDGSSSVSGILLSGLSGTGKSFLCSILGSVYESKCSVYGSEDIISPYKRETESVLKKIFDKANKKVPYLIVIDNIDEICSGRDEDSTNTRIVNAFLHLIDGGQAKKRVLVIATASKPDKLDQALRRPGRLSHDIALNIPDEKSRMEILKNIFKNAKSSDEVNFYEAIASKTSGFVAADLIHLIEEAYSYSGKEQPTYEHFCNALLVVKPIALKNIPTRSYSVSMDDVKNCADIKKDLVSLFDVTLRYKNLFVVNEITSPTRILLFGPSGCGKTMITHALANQFNLNVIVVKRSNVFGKYFGESEKNLGLLFEQAANSAPCILHFDNLVGIAGKKSRESEISNDVEGRVINHLKVLLDGVKGFENIYVIAETNRPDLLDQDVIRHGRFHKYVYIDLPSEEDRKYLLERHFKSMYGDFCHEYSSTIDELVAKTKRFSVAEVKLLCKEISNSMKENLNSTTNLDTSVSSEAMGIAIEEALEVVSPSNTSKILKRNLDFASIYGKRK